MIENLYENEVGYRVGTFYADIFGYEMEVWFKGNVTLEYAEKNIHYLNHLDREFLVRICEALKRYYEGYRELYPDLCEEIPTDLSEEFERDPASILGYIKLGVYKFGECISAVGCQQGASADSVPLNPGGVQESGSEEGEYVIKLGGECAWSGDKGVTIVARNNELLYVGPWIYTDAWSSYAGVKSNYASPEKKGFWMPSVQG